MLASGGQGLWEGTWCHAQCDRSAEGNWRLWLVRPVLPSPTNKVQRLCWETGLRPAPHLRGPVDTFAQKVVCLLETGPLWGRPRDSTAQVLTGGGSCGCTKRVPPSGQPGLCFLFSSGKWFASSWPQFPHLQTWDTGFRLQGSGGVQGASDRRDLEAVPSRQARVRRTREGPP